MSKLDKGTDRGGGITLVDTVPRDEGFVLNRDGAYIQQDFGLRTNGRKTGARTDVTANNRRRIPTAQKNGKKSFSKLSANKSSAKSLMGLSIEEKLYELLLVRSYENSKACDDDKAPQGRATKATTGSQGHTAPEY